MKFLGGGGGFSSIKADIVTEKAIIITRQEKRIPYKQLLQQTHYYTLY